MTAEQITEYTIINLRNQLLIAAEELTDILRDVENSDETPEGAADRVNAEIEKINRLTP